MLSQYVCSLEKTPDVSVFPRCAVTTYSCANAPLNGTPPRIVGSIRDDIKAPDSIWNYKITARQSVPIPCVVKVLSVSFNAGPLCSPQNAR